MPVKVVVIEVYVGVEEYIFVKEGVGDNKIRIV